MDSHETKKVLKRHKRELADICRTIGLVKKQSSLTNKVRESTSLYQCHLNQRKRFSDTENDFQPPENFPNAAKRWQMRIKFKATAQTSEKYNVSDHAAAVIASSISQDVGLITDIETS